MEVSIKLKNFGTQSYSIYLFVYNLAPFVAFFARFGPAMLFFGVKIKCKNFLGFATIALSYCFKFCPILALFRPYWPIFWAGIKLKNFLEPSYYSGWSGGGVGLGGRLWIEIKTNSAQLKPEFGLSLSI